MDYILNPGVFGYDDKNVLGTIFKKDENNNIKLLVKKIFPPMEVMTDRFIWFRNSKNICYPIHG